MRIRRAALALALLGLLALASSEGQTRASCLPIDSYTPFAFESLTISNTSVGLTTATFAPSGQPPAVYASGRLETNPARYRSDGVAPTAAVGVLINSSDGVEVCGEQNLRAVRFIRQGAADATLQIVYYRKSQ